MVEITPDLIIQDGEIDFEFVRASGPGGQNVNKVATAVQLRFDVDGSPSLPEDVRQRLKRLAGRRLNVDGVLVIEARRYRTQERNRQDALDKLVELVRRAAHRPVKRRATRPTPASQERRLQSKRRHGLVKRLRGARDDVD